MASRVELFAREGGVDLIISHQSHAAGRGRHVNRGDGDGPWGLALGAPAGAAPAAAG